MTTRVATQAPQMAGRSLPRIVVAVITAGIRPELLRELLVSLSRQTGAGDRFELLIAVVDNGATPSVSSAIAPPGVKLYIAHEPRAGIPYARNRSVELARACEPDFVAFIDDDEWASERWLEESLVALERHGADAVAGSVQYHFAVSVPTWRREGGFYDSPDHETGEVLGFARTTNLVIRAQPIWELGAEPFDVSLRFTGGSDVRFTERLVANGVKICWSREATTHEHVPAERCTAKWAMRRAYRVGNTAGRSITRSRGKLARTHTVLVGVSRVPYAILLLVGGLLRARQDRIGNAFRVGARGVGIALSPFHRYEEYRQ